MGVLATPGTAGAGPGPSVGSLATPAGTNTATVTSWSAKTGAVWGELRFRSTASHAVVQISKNAPVIVDGTPSLGAAQPIVLAGTAVPGGLGDLATATTYRFELDPDGLSPDTTYHVLVSLPGQAGQDANVVAKTFTTKRRVVTATVEWIHVSDDSDPGLARGAGEMRFGVRVAPDASKLASRSFSGWTGWLSLATGADKVFAGGTLAAQADTRTGHAYVQVQGQEDDGIPVGDPVGDVVASPLAGRLPVEGAVGLDQRREVGDVVEAGTGDGHRVHGAQSAARRRPFPRGRRRSSVRRRRWEAP